MVGEAQNTPLTILWIREESRKHNSNWLPFCISSSSHASIISVPLSDHLRLQPPQIPPGLCLPHPKNHHQTRTQETKMAATISTMAILNAKCLGINTTPKATTTASKPPSPKPISLLSTANLPKGLITPEPSNCSSAPTSLAGTALAGAFFSALNSCEPAMAAQQIAEIAEGDNRGLALLLPIIPALAWVLYNILQPALNQINRMRNEKAVIIGLGLGGLAASGFFLSTPHALASEIAVVADAASDNRGQLLLFVILPAIAWVLYNILQPALNQINRMRSQ